MGCALAAVAVGVRVAHDVRGVQIDAQQKHISVIQQPQNVRVILYSVTVGGSISHGQDPTRRLRIRDLKGDHSPYHVHVYRDGTLVLKWDLENHLPMKGKPTSRILRLITELSEEGLL